MNQITLNTEKSPTAAINMTTSEGGSKLAPQTLSEVVKFAEVMCRADIALPKHLRGNAGACMAVALQAMEWNLSPFAVASKSYSVGGAIAYEAQLIAAVVNTRSGIKGRLKYSFDGEGPAMTCTVTGTLDGEECVYTSPAIGSITTKNSPLWKSDPQQQLGYFSARSWARRHCPEVILGVYDRDEAEEFRGADNAKDVTPKPSIQDRLLAAKSATYSPADTQEGFDRDFVADQTNSGTAGDPAPEIEYTAPTSSPDAVTVGAGLLSGTSDEGAETAFDVSAPDEISIVNCARKMLALANTPTNDKPALRGALELSKNMWKEALDKADHEALKSIFLSADNIIKGNVEYQAAVEFFAEAFGVTPSEIVG